MLRAAPGRLQLARGFSRLLPPPLPHLSPPPLLYPPRLLPAPPAFSLSPSRRLSSSQPSPPLSDPAPLLPPKLTERPPLYWAPIYLELSKSRLSGFVAMTTLAGYALGAPPFHAPTAVAALAGTFLCSASANAFNQLIEIDRDRSMKRTSKRPLPSFRILPAHARWFAGSAGVAGVGTLLLGANPLTAGLGLSTLGLYTLLYTPMKVRCCAVSLQLYVHVHTQLLVRQ